MKYLIDIYYEPLSAVILMIIMSIGIRFLLQLIGQRWITSMAHTSTLVLLPVLTFTITKVISGNIALSLGMVGALSIVRFRNPVRSPLELSVYFAAITMGISASVSMYWLVFLSMAIMIVIVSLYLLQIILSTFFNKSFFMSSFLEGNTMSVLEITLKQENSILDESTLLTFKSNSNDEIKYALCSSTFSELTTLIEELKKNNTQMDYQLKK